MKNLHSANDSLRKREAYAEDRGFDTPTAHVGSTSHHHKCLSLEGGSGTARSHHPGKTGGALMHMINGLESIESDKEGEDIQRISYEQNELQRK